MEGRKGLGDGDRDAAPLREGEGVKVGVVHGEGEGVGFGAEADGEDVELEEGQRVGEGEALDVGSSCVGDASVLGVDVEEGVLVSAAKLALELNEAEREGDSEVLLEVQAVGEGELLAHLVPPNAGLPLPHPLPLPLPDTEPETLADGVLLAASVAVAAPLPLAPTDIETEELPPPVVLPVLLPLKVPPASEALRVPLPQLVSDADPDKVESSEAVPKALLADPVPPPRPNVEVPLPLPPPPRLCALAELQPDAEAHWVALSEELPHSVTLVLPEVEDEGRTVREPEAQGEALRSAEVEELGVDEGLLRGTEALPLREGVVEPLAQPLAERVRAAAVWEATMLPLRRGETLALRTLVLLRVPEAQPLLLAAAEVDGDALEDGKSAVSLALTDGVVEPLCEELGQPVGVRSAVVNPLALRVGRPAVTVGACAVPVAAEASEAVGEMEEEEAKELDGEAHELQETLKDWVPPPINDALPAPVGVLDREALPLPLCKPEPLCVALLHPDSVPGAASVEVESSVPLEEPQLQDESLCTGVREVQGDAESVGLFVKAAAVPLFVPLMRGELDAERGPEALGVPRALRVGLREKTPLGVGGCALPVCVGEGASVRTEELDAEEDTEVKASVPVIEGVGEAALLALMLEDAVRTGLAEPLCVGVVVIEGEGEPEEEKKRTVAVALAAADTVGWGDMLEEVNEVGVVVTKKGDADGFGEKQARGVTVMRSDVVEGCTDAVPVTAVEGDTLATPLADGEGVVERDIEGDTVALGLGEFNALAVGAAREAVPISDTVWAPWGENVAAGLCEGAPLVALCVNVPEPLALTAPAEGVAPLPPLAVGSHTVAVKATEAVPAAAETVAKLEREAAEIKLRDGNATVPVVVALKTDAAVTVNVGSKLPVPPPSGLSLCVAENDPRTTEALALALLNTASEGVPLAPLPEDDGAELPVPDAHGKPLTLGVKEAVASCVTVADPVAGAPEGEAITEPLPQPLVVVEGVLELLALGASWVKVGETAALPLREREAEAVALTDRTELRLGEGQAEPPLPVAEPNADALFATLKLRLPVPLRLPLPVLLCELLPPVPQEETVGLVKRVGSVEGVAHVVTEGVSEPVAASAVKVGSGALCEAKGEIDPPVEGEGGPLALVDSEGEEEAQAVPAALV